MPKPGAVLRAGQEAILARLGRHVSEGVHEGPLRLGQDLAGLDECCRVVVGAAQSMQPKIPLEEDGSNEKNLHQTIDALAEMKSKENKT